MDHFGKKKASVLISPYRGDLVDLMLPAADAAGIFSYAAGLISVQLTTRQTCDLEIMATGGFSPLDRFLGEKDYLSVLDTMRLSDGTVFPIPITLPVENISGLTTGDDVALRNSANDLLAVMTVDEIYEWEKERFAEAVCGTSDPRHPLVAEMAAWGRFNLSGELQVLRHSRHDDFNELRLTPRQTRTLLKGMGRQNVVAFQTRNPIHRGHEALTKRALEITDGNLLIHPPVGVTKPGDIDYVTRVRTYKAVAASCYPRDRVALALLPLAMRMAGPREAVWHAIIRRNYGANHFIVGRDHASPGPDANGEPFYEPLAAQSLATALGPEIGVKILSFNEFVYLPDEGRYDEINSGSERRKTHSLSGTRLRKEFLTPCKPVPEWFMRKEVSAILSESYPPRSRQGVCLWLTGLSGAGKSTTAEVVAALLLEEGRQVTLLDGDVVRTMLSKGLGFSKEDRDTNIRRIGFVASEVVRHGGVAVCAAISPYRDARSQVRLMFGDDQFIEVFVDTPLHVCEERDTKGMYAKAHRGEIENFTGVSDAYEVPTAPEIKLDTVAHTARENARLIVEYLRKQGFLALPECSSEDVSLLDPMLVGEPDVEFAILC